MHDELGFPRYGAHGGDLGAGITSRLGEAYPGALAAIHLLAIADPVAYDPSTVTPKEQAYLDSVAAWFAAEDGYQHEQSTRSVTLSYGLSDSPAGLLAWIAEKYRAWSDCKGDLSSRFRVPTAVAVFPADLTRTARPRPHRVLQDTAVKPLPRVFRTMNESPERGE
ncbi:MAG: hypothetical protein ACRDN0_20970 [Trebonia sp.]